MRQSHVTATENRRSVNLEAEKKRLIRESEEVIKKFSNSYLYSNPGTLRKNVRDKTYVDGSRYIGEARNDHRHGKGIYYYSNGDAYVGDWRDDQFHGKGTYIFANSERFEGELREGLKHGTGVYHYINGNRYEGEWSNDRKNGVGTYIYFASGEKYQGEWKDGEKNGKGTYFFAYGDKYVGEWRNGKKSGHGILMYGSGAVYEGGWADDLATGTGYLTYPNGDKYYYNIDHDHNLLILTITRFKKTGYTLFSRQYFPLKCKLRVISSSLGSSNCSSKTNTRNRKFSIYEFPF